MKLGWNALELTVGSYKNGSQTLTSQFFGESGRVTHMECWWRDLPGDPVVKTPPCNAGDAGLIPGWGTKILYAAQHCRKKKKENTGKLYYLTKNNRK